MLFRSKDDAVEVELADEPGTKSSGVGMGLVDLLVAHGVGYRQTQMSREAPMGLRLSSFRSPSAIRSNAMTT